MTIGEKIKTHRKKAGLTQKKLGELSGTSETTIKQYELGKRQPRLEQLQKIAKALNISPYTFLNDDFFDVATDTRGEYEEKLINDKFSFITENNELCTDEKETLLKELALNMEITANMHAHNAEISGKFLINKFFDMLNFNGQEKAIEHLELLTKIPEYQKK